jgi:hypothetical protein
MLFTKDMSDFEKLMFTEDYIKLLKKALRESQKNEIVYKKNIKEIVTVFKEANSKFGKLTSYKREMNSLREKAKRKELKSEKLEQKNYILRQKLRDAKEI